MKKDVRKQVKLQPSTHSNLISVAGEMQNNEGESVTLDDAISKLITFWRSMPSAHQTRKVK